jgi:regulator of RNase E activity RraA
MTGCAGWGGCDAGHYVYADSAGAVVIPAPEVRNVLEEAARIERQDVLYLDQIKAEHPNQTAEETDER